jgi:hypothetical protein
MCLCLRLHALWQFIKNVDFLWAQLFLLLGNTSSRATRNQARHRGQLGTILQTATQIKEKIFPAQGALTIAVTTAPAPCCRPDDHQYTHPFIIQTNIEVNTIAQKYTYSLSSDHARPGTVVRFPGGFQTYNVCGGQPCREGPRIDRTSEKSPVEIPFKYKTGCRCWEPGEDSGKNTRGKGPSHMVQLPVINAGCRTDTGPRPVIISRAGK